MLRSPLWPVPLTLVPLTSPFPFSGLRAAQDRIRRCTFLAPIRPPLTERPQAICQLPPPNPERLDARGLSAPRVAVVHSVLGALAALNHSAAVLRIHPARFEARREGWDSWPLLLLTHLSFPEIWETASKDERSRGQPPPRPTLQFKGHFPGADYPGPAD